MAVSFIKGSCLTVENIVEVVDQTAARLSLTLFSVR